MSNVYGISLSGDIESFDTSSLNVRADLTSIQVNVDGREDAGSVGKHETGSDKEATYSISTSPTAEIRIECMGTGPAKFYSVGEGKGQSRLSFRDGEGGSGTGYAKAAELIRAEGDLYYLDKDGKSVGDIESELEGQITILGIGIVITPKVGEGTITGALSDTGIKTIVDRIFETTVASNIKVEIKADDQATGYATVSSNMKTSYDVVIEGSRCERDNLVSTIYLHIKKGGIVMKVETKDRETGYIVENITTNFKSPVAELSVIDGEQIVNSGWGTSGRNTWTYP